MGTDKILKKEKPVPEEKLTAEDLAAIERWRIHYDYLYDRRLKPGDH